MASLTVEITEKYKFKVLKYLPLHIAMAIIHNDLEKFYEDNENIILMWF